MIPLQKFFTIVWKAFLDGNGMDMLELELAIKACGLGEYRPATPEDVRDDSIFRVGDSLMVLTNVGRKAVRVSTGDRA